MSFDLFFVLSSVVGLVMIADGALLLLVRRMSPATGLFSLVEFVWFLVALNWVLDWGNDPWRWLPLSFIGYAFAWWTYALCTRFETEIDWREFEVPRSWGYVGVLFGLYYTLANGIAAANVP